MKPTFALKDNKPVHISEVERGLACRCVCSACGHPLQARKGPKVRPYFAHDKGSECSVETVIHNMAKKIIMDTGEIYIPATTCEILNYVYYDMPGQVISLSDVQEEYDMSNIRPDIIGYYNGKPLLIEVYVTHKIDDDKVLKIKDKGIAAIEINLSNIGYDTDLDKLKNLVLYETSNREWINNERLNELQNRLLTLREYKQVFRCTRNWTKEILIYDNNESSQNAKAMKVENIHCEDVKMFVVDCPINRRTEDGHSYAWFTDCRDCRYRYGDNYPNGLVVCAGKLKVAQ